MIDLQLPYPPAEMLRRLAEFGADWRESKIPTELRQAGILGAGVQIRDDQFTMTIRAARRSPNLELHGVVAANPDGGSRVSGAVQLSTANQVMRAAFVVIIGALVWGSSGFLTAALASIALIAVIAGLSAAGGRFSEREYRTLPEQAAHCHRDPAT